MHRNTKISKNKRVIDWINLRNSIDDNPFDKNNWGIAFDEIFMDRIDSRFLSPIKNLKNEIHGGGFAIVTIQCSLIEFLETTLTGETYKLKNPNPENFEYNRSGIKFKNFLTNRFPFKKHFDDDLANSFYENVRNGLIHEAQTKSNWIIRVDNKNKLIENDQNDMIVFDRSKFQKLFRIFFKKYKAKLMEDVGFQSSLRRKLNAICRLPIRG